MANVIGFYRESEKYGCFSNFYRAPFLFMDVEFRFAEQMIMWQKAMLFSDTRVADLILQSSEPKEVKRLGREVTPFYSDTWDEKREELVVPGLYEKFRQNADIRSILLGTGDALIAECSPRDRIWGIGRAVWHPDINNPKCWRGTNLLGKYLMQVRDRLVEEGYTE